MASHLGGATASYSNITYSSGLFTSSILTTPEMRRASTLLSFKIILTLH